MPQRRYLQMMLIAGQAKFNAGPSTFQLLSNWNPSTGDWSGGLEVIDPADVEYMDGLPSPPPDRVCGIGAISWDDAMFPELWVSTDHGGQPDLNIQRYEDIHDAPGGGLPNIVLDVDYEELGPNYHCDLLYDHKWNKVLALPAWVDVKTDSFERPRSKLFKSQWQDGGWPDEVSSDPSKIDSWVNEDGIIFGIPDPDDEDDDAPDHMRVGTIVVRVVVDVDGRTNEDLATACVQVKLTSVGGSDYSETFTQPNWQWVDLNTCDQITFVACFVEPETVAGPGGAIAKYIEPNHKWSILKDGFRIEVTSPNGDVQDGLPTSITVEFHACQGGVLEADDEDDDNPSCKWNTGDAERPDDLEAAEVATISQGKSYQVNSLGTEYRIYPYLFTGLAEDDVHHYHLLDVRNRVSTVSYSSGQCPDDQEETGTGTGTGTGCDIYTRTIKTHTGRSGNNLVEDTIQMTFREDGCVTITTGPQLSTYICCPFVGTGTGTGTGTGGCEQPEGPPTVCTYLAKRVWKMNGRDGRYYWARDIQAGAFRFATCGFADGFLIYEEDTRELIAGMIHHDCPANDVFYHIANLDLEGNVLDLKEAPAAIQHMNAGRNARKAPAVREQDEQHWRHPVSLTRAKGPVGPDRRSRAPLIADECECGDEEPDLTCSPTADTARPMTADIQTILDGDPVDASPYLVLEVNWTGGSEFFTDRPLTDFQAAGSRGPATVKPLVVSWGRLSQDLKEGQMNATDATSVVLADPDRDLWDQFEADIQQQQTAVLWLMVDDPTVTWPDDRVKLFVGRLTPPSFNESQNQVTINLVDAFLGLKKMIGKNAVKSVFAVIPPESEDRFLPIAWGCAKRVEAVLVRQPWKTTSLEFVYIEDNVATPAKIDILEHPSDLGIPTGAAVDAHWAGMNVLVEFTQSGDPANTPSQMEILDQSFILGRGLVGHVQGNTAYLSLAHLWPTNQTGGAKRWHRFDAPKPPNRDPDPANYLRPNMEIRIRKVNGAVSGTTTLSDWRTHDPGRSWLKVDLAHPVQRGDILEFLDPEAKDVTVRPGAVVKEHQDDAQWIYVANTFPSKEVVDVEGFGQFHDEGGREEAGFTAIDRDWYDVNLDDNAWAAGLGHNVTTIRFHQAPAALSQNLQSNRIWVTLVGKVDGGGDAITNPAAIIREYIEGSDLGNLAGALMDSTNWDEAEACLAATAFGFAQIEPVDLLTYVQSLAAQCHSVIQFDQGLCRMLVLRHTAGTAALTLDQSDLYERTIQISERSLDKIVNQVAVRARWKWDDQDGGDGGLIGKSHAATIAALGRQQRTLDFFAYSCEVNAAAEAQWWLDWWRNVKKTVSFQMGIQGLVLRPGDWITITFVDGEANTVLDAVDFLVVNVKVDWGGKRRPFGVTVTAQDEGTSF